MDINKHISSGQSLEKTESISESITEGYSQITSIFSLAIKEKSGQLSFQDFKPKALKIKAADFFYEFNKAVLENNKTKLGLFFDEVLALLEKHSNLLEECKKALAIPLIHAAFLKRWDFVSAILKVEPQVNTDASITKGLYKGRTTLLLAAISNQWDLVWDRVIACPNANINANSLEGIEKGKSVLWLAARADQWHFVDYMLKYCPHADINAAPVHGVDRDRTVFWIAANNLLWDFVLYMLENYPNVNLDACSADGETVLDLALGAHYNKNLASQVAYLCVFLGAGQPQQHQKEYDLVKAGIGSSLERLATAVRQADDGYMNNFSKLPLELEQKILIQTLRSDCPWLSSLSDQRLWKKIEAYLLQPNNQSK